jgi:hypothetical protein
MTAPVVGQPHPGSGSLNQAGYAILEALDYRVVSLMLLGLVLVLWIYARLRLKRHPTRDECLKAVEGGVSIAMAIIVGTVFLLTDPPAVEMLPHEMRGVVGLFTGIILFAVGYERIADSFRASGPSKAPPSA